MGFKRFEILIGEQSCSARLQFEIGGFLEWQNVLRNVHAIHPEIRCQCRRNNDDERNDVECRLEVRCLNGLFFLARRRHTGPQHHDEYRFYAAALAKSGIGAYADGLVDDDDDEIRIRVGMGLKVQEDLGATVVMLRKQRKLKKNVITRRTMGFKVKDGGAGNPTGMTTFIRRFQSLLTAVDHEKNS